MNFTLHQLNIFIKVVDCQSVTRASEELHLTQPAVSIQLKRLQEQFEIPLTEVVKRKLYVTDFGKQVAIVAKKILEDAEAIRSTVNQYKGILTGKIKISVVSTGKYVIPYFLKPFMQDYPGVEMTIDVSNKNTVIEGLKKNESDFSLVSLLPDDIPINRITLMENRLYLVGSSNYQGGVVTLKKLENLTLIFREKGSATRGIMEQYLKEHGVKPGKTMELVSNEAVKQAVNAGLGFSIMPLIGLSNELANGSLNIYPIKGLPIVTNWHLIYNKEKRLAPAAQQLLKSISDHRDRVIEEFFNWPITGLE